MARADDPAAAVDAGAREHYADAALYDYEYRRRRADVTFYRALAQRILGGPGELLELGCGSGRVTIPLARDGHTITALDQSPAMLDRLRARATGKLAPRIHAVEGDLCWFSLPGDSSSDSRSSDLRLANGRSSGHDPSSGARSSAKRSSRSGSSGARASDKRASEGRSSDASDASPPQDVSEGRTKRFPLVVAAFNVLEHLYTRTDLAACLARVKDHLADGGTFAFDVQNPDLAWLIRDPSKRWARTRFTDPSTGRAMLYSTNHDYDPISQIALIRLYYEPADGRGPNRVVHLSQRKWFPAELEALVAHAGFTVAERFGDFFSSPLDGPSESQVLICKVAPTRNSRLPSRI